MTFDSPVTMNFAAHWDFDPQMVPLPVNQFLLQQGLPLGDGSDAREILVVLGHVNPPAILPQPDGSVEIPGVENGRLPVAIHGNFIFTRERAREFAQLLLNWVDQPQTTRLESFEADPGQVA